MIKNKSKLRTFLGLLAQMQHLKEVSQTDEIAEFLFISNFDVFDLSHASLSELGCQGPRYGSDFLLLLIDQ